MKIYKDLAEWFIEREQIKNNNAKIGFVPTLGALHLGHESLLNTSIKQNDFTVLSLFVNPTQFDQAQDFKNYPINIESDLKIAEKLGVSHVLMPNKDQIYLDGYRFRLSESTLSKRFCGAHRVGHFDGVLTVVLKLFNIVQPDRAYFGEKDYQQLRLIEDMVQALYLPIDIIRCETVREEDGLALSSRNLRLNQDARLKASYLRKVIQKNISTQEAIDELVHLGFKVDYVDDFENRRLAAVHLDGVRLIDNVKR